jgi:hypothetical protein
VAFGGVRSDSVFGVRHHRTLGPIPAEEMKAWKVGSDVGNARNNNPALVEPVSRFDSAPLIRRAI